MTLELEARTDIRTGDSYTGQFKVKKLTGRRLGDQRRLTSSEELTKGAWVTKFDHTAEAPAGYGSETKTEPETRD
jgi:hypothetical protein